MAKASISTAWDETKSVISRSANPLGTVALALLVFPSTILGALAPPALTGMAPVGSALTSLLMLTVMILGLIGRLTIARIALGPVITVGGAMSQALRRTLSTAAAFLIFLLPVAILMSPFLLQVIQSPENPPALASWVVLLSTLLAFAFGVRLLSMVIPAAANEPVGPFALLKRSWKLTAGMWWRLILLVLVFFIGSELVSRAAGYIAGSVLILLTGPMEPLSVSALVFSATFAIVGAIFSVIFIVMLTRIYAQLSGETLIEPTVPSSGT